LGRCDGGELIGRPKVGEVGPECDRIRWVRNLRPTVTNLIEKRE
jgi:hypothetical protein